MHGRYKDPYCSLPGQTLGRIVATPHKPQQKGSSPNLCPVQADLWICLSATSTPGAPGCTKQVSAEQRATEITREVKHVSDEGQDENGKVISSASAQQVLTALSCQAEGNLVKSTRPQWAPWPPLATQASCHLTLRYSGLFLPEGLCTCSLLCPGYSAPRSAFGRCCHALQVTARDVISPQGHQVHFLQLFCLFLPRWNFYTALRAKSQSFLCVC